MNLKGMMIGSEQPQVLGEFYTKIFGEPSMKDEENGWWGFEVGVGSFAVGPHSEVKGKNPSPGRIIFNVETNDVEGEFERMKGQGAEVVAEPYHPGGMESMTLATLADPDGNYFQLSTPWVPPSK